MTDRLIVEVADVRRMPRTISGGIEPRVPCRHCGHPFTRLLLCPACGCPVSLPLEGKR